MLRAYSSSMIIHALLLLVLIPLAAGAAQPLSLWQRQLLGRQHIRDKPARPPPRHPPPELLLVAVPIRQRLPWRTAWALVLCRGDVSADECYGCVTSAGQDAATACNRSRDVALCYNKCYVRLANHNFFDPNGNSGVVSSMSPLNITSSDVVRYDRALTGLLSDTVQYAVDNSSRLFATGDWAGTDPGFPAIYSAEQCAADLSRPQCRNCLQGLMGMWRTTFLRNMWGARLAGPRCTLRSELFRFYNHSDSMLPFFTGFFGAAEPPAAATATRDLHKEGDCRQLEFRT